MMRLWHVDILDLLPDLQLLAQKREVDLIWKDIKQGRKTNHILINYIWEYEDFTDRVKSYYILLEKAFDKRGFKFKNNCFEYGKAYIIYENPFPMQHNDRYLLQNFLNLQEKFDRHQKGFTREQYINLREFVEQYTGIDLTYLGC